MLIRLYIIFYKKDTGVFTVCIDFYRMLNYDGTVNVTNWLQEYMTVADVLQ